MPLRNGLPETIIPTLAAEFMKDHGTKILVAAICEDYTLEQMVGQYLSNTLGVTRRGTGVSPFIKAVVVLLEAKVKALEPKSSSVPK